MEGICDYWSNKKIACIANLLHEYQDVFSRDYKDLKGLVKDIGDIKIDLVPGYKPTKK